MTHETKTQKGISQIAAGILIGVVISFVLFSYLQSTKFSLNTFANSFTNLIFPTQSTATTSSSTSQSTTQNGQGNTGIGTFALGKEVKLVLPAVDDQGNGVTTNLYVEAIQGKGRVLVDVNNIFFFTDTQNSIRYAQRVAQNVTGMDLSNIDLIYRIDAGNVSLLEGPSAGASLTVATVAALEGKSVNSSVILTGTIEPDGTIGPVGGIAEKVKASKEIGASLLLVPKGQGTVSTYTPKQKCEQIGPILYCTSEYQGTKKDISSATGIEVKEVSNIKEALPYFLV